ncbi:MAG: site-2 protease family protein [Simkaniaceae bacterium]
MSILTIILAALGLSFLVFIHELGHYIAARRVGMVVEVFSIGFGPAFLKWERKGVRWQICYFLFGGFVKIKGMEVEKGEEPSEITDGFYQKSPWARIKVAFMGPLVNILFALLVFCGIWALGGREKPFSNYTQITGWINQESAFAEKGLSAGDTITYLNEKPYNGAEDLIKSVIIKQESLRLQGEKVGYFDGKEVPYDYLVSKKNLTLEAFFQQFAPANFLFYAGDSAIGIKNLGLLEGDRLIWADGEILFSLKQLNAIINNDKTFLTVKRGEQTFHTKAPRVLVRDIQLTPQQLGEIDDWQHEADFKGDPKALYFLPYEFNSKGKIIEKVRYLDSEFQWVYPKAESIPPFQDDLQIGDQIIAVDGFKVDNVFDLLKRVQKRHINLIAQKKSYPKNVPPRVADKAFREEVNWQDVLTLAALVGREGNKDQGDLFLIKPIEARPITDFAPLGERIFTKMKELSSKKLKSEKSQEILVDQDNHLALGIQLRDQAVQYNPTPLELFSSVFKETYQTLISLISGLLSPKYVSGPVGIVQVMHMSFQTSFKEAFYWLGVISLNLGLLNLLPLPILDGGHICFSLIEMVRKKPLKAKTMQRLIIPFVVIFILFFLFITFQDILKIYR